MVNAQTTTMKNNEKRHHRSGKRNRTKISHLLTRLLPCTGGTATRKCTAAVTFIPGAVCICSNLTIRTRCGVARRSTTVSTTRDSFCTATLSVVYTYGCVQPCFRVHLTCVFVRDQLGDFSVVAMATKYLCTSLFNIYLLLTLFTCLQRFV